MAYGNGKRFFRQMQQRVQPGRKGRTVEEEVLGYDFVEFTAHALDRMKERGVSQREVFLVLKSPTKKGLPTQSDRERWRRFRQADLAVDVVFEYLPTKILIVTVMVIDV